MVNRKKCKACGEPCASYLWGMPNYPAIEEQLRKGEIVLGGCCIEYPSPNWYCNSCHIDYYSGGFGKWNKENWLESNELLEEELDPYVFDDKYTSLLPERVNKILSTQLADKLEDNRSFSFHFHIGGYDATKTDYFFDGNILIVRSSDFLINSYQVPDEIIVLSKSQVDELKDFLLNSSWEEQYRNPDVLDGTEWSLIANIKGKLIDSYGHMVFPEVYDVFNSLIHDMIDNRD